MAVNDTAANERLRVKWKTWIGGIVPTARHAHASVVYENFLYVFGGYGVGGIHLNDMHRLDLETRIWEEVSTIKSQQPLDQPPPVHSHCLVIYDDALWMFGGVSKQSQTDNSVYRMSFATRRWIRVETHGLTPPGRWGHAGSIVGKELVLFGGMRDSGDLIADIFALDLSTLVWRKVETEGIGPAPSHHLSACTINNNSVFLFGGYSSSRNFGALFRLDFPLQGQQSSSESIQRPAIWTDLSSIPSAPAARRSHTMVAYGNKLYIFGGRGSRTRLNDLCCFDTKQLKWISIDIITEGDEAPCPRGFHTATMYRNKMIIFAGIADECLNDTHFLELPEIEIQQNKSFNTAIQNKRLGGALGQLFNEGLFSDVKFIIGGDIQHPIQAHKCILASRSEHFRAMLTSGLAESISGIIKLDDIHRHPFEMFLKFLYTDKIEFGISTGCGKSNDCGDSDDIGNEIIELLILADRFVVESLRTKCENLLIQYISPENVNDLLIIAQSHNCPSLSSKCLFVLSSSQHQSTSQQQQ